MLHCEAEAEQQHLLMQKTKILIQLFEIFVSKKPQKAFRGEHMVHDPRWMPTKAEQVVIEASRNSQLLKIPPQTKRSNLDTLLESNGNICHQSDRKENNI